MSSIPNKVLPYLLILRWVIAGIFFYNGVLKLDDPGFGADADHFFRELSDHVILKPYNIVLNDLVIPNAPIFASLVKYGEIALGVTFFLGWPLRLAAIFALILHVNYICIADYKSYLLLNVLMIVVEWTCVNAFEKDK